MTSVATPASLRLASSSTFCSRLTAAERSSTRVVRVRVRSRSSRWGRSGMKLARSSPCRSRSAIHSASLTSVLRPGTALMCGALTTSTSQLALQHVVDRLPVDAGALHRHVGAAGRRSQSASASRSSVIVAKVRTSRLRCRRRPRAPGRPRPSSCARPVRSSTSTAPPSAHPFRTDRDADAGVAMSRLSVACFPAGSHRRWCRATPRSNWSAGSSHQTRPDLVRPRQSRQRRVPPRCPFSSGDGRGAPRGKLV